MSLRAGHHSLTFILLLFSSFRREAQTFFFFLNQLLQDLTEDLILLLCPGSA